jgi:hypothetical protein
LSSRWWTLYAAAAVTFLPTLWFYYVGEEAIFPKSALEMWYHNEPVRRLLFGADLQHNPLFIWLIVPLTTVFGWEEVLPVTRALTVGATVATGGVVAWLAQSLYGNRVFSAVAAVVYLTLADVFLYRGWLAYVDPLFGLLVFAAMASLWVASERRSHALLAIAVVALTAAFLAKALTAYAFYAAAAFVLVLRRAEYRRFLLSAPSLLLHGCAVAALILWLGIFASTSAQGSRMLGEILAKLIPEHMGSYLLKLVSYPLETLLCLAPAGLVAAWVVVRRRQQLADARDFHLMTAMLIAALGYLPYWLAPQSHVRYLMPLYPLAGLAIARVLWLGADVSPVMVRNWLIGIFSVKLVLVLVAFPLYQQRYRGSNYLTTARAIVERTAGQALYSNNVSASGLSVAAYIDVARLPQAPLTFPPGEWSDGFVIAYEPDPKIGRIDTQYRLGGNTLYLLCRGSACREGGRR